MYYPRKRIIHWRRWINTSFSIPISPLSSSSFAVLDGFLFERMANKFWKTLLWKIYSPKMKWGYLCKEGDESLILLAPSAAAAPYWWCFFKMYLGLSTTIPLLFDLFWKKECSIFRRKFFWLTYLHTRYFAHMHNYLIDPISTKRGAQAALTQFWNVCS